MRKHWRQDKSPTFFLIYFLPDCDVVQLLSPEWAICQDDSAYTFEPCCSRTGVELLELSMLRSLRLVERQPCALQFYLQEIAQSRASGDPERDPLHPGPSSPSQTLLSREAGVLRAALHAWPVQRDGRGGRGGEGAAERGKEPQCQGSRALQEKLLQCPACRVQPCRTALPSGPSVRPQPCTDHSTGHQLS